MTSNSVISFLDNLFGISILKAHWKLLTAPWEKVLMYPDIWFACCNKLMVWVFFLSAIITSIFAEEYLEENPLKLVQERVL
jgi:hypothetical protein